MQTAFPRGNLPARPVTAGARRLLRRGRRALGAGACAIIAGCAAPSLNPAPEAVTATVVGWGGSAGEQARAALTPAPGTRVAMLVVVKANEKDISYSENVARLAPGNYNLTIACVLYVDYRSFRVDSVLEAKLAAGRVYRLQADPQGRRCQPSLDAETARDGK